MPALTPKAAPGPRHMEAVIDDLSGAASIAAAILDHIRIDPCAGDSRALDTGLVWLATRLNAAAENALAVQERRAPRWMTLAQSEDIAEAVADAIAAAHAREAGE